MRIGALKSALSLFVKEGRLIVLDNIELAEIKTKALAAVLDKLQIARKALVVDDPGNEKLKLSLRNMQDHQFLPPRSEERRVGKECRSRRWADDDKNINPIQT